MARRRGQGFEPPPWMELLSAATAPNERTLATKIRLAALHARWAGERPSFSVAAERAARAAEMLAAAGFIEIAEEGRRAAAGGVQLVTISFALGASATWDME